eukprot:GHVL01008727.1.p1 GENE.GHVL01008727.1~~GHVL01008727.1.p1  ORF type:complete len:365 (+),score=46.63 GHVL01008727.1:7-1101(+)
MSDGFDEIESSGEPDGDIPDQEPEQPSEAAVTPPENADEPASDGEAPDDSGEPVDPDSSLTTSEDHPAPPKEKEEAPSERDQLLAELEQIKKDRAEFQTLYQKNKEQLKQFADVDPRLVQEWKRGQEQVKLTNLPPWHIQSPKHQEYRQSVEKIRQVQKQAQAIRNSNDERLTPEAKQAQIQALEGQLSDSDWQHLEAQQNHAQAISDAMFSSPDFAHMVSSPMDYFSRVFDYHIKQYEAQRNASSSVNEWWDKNADTVERYRDEVNKRVDAGWGFDQVREWVELRAERDGLHEKQEKLSAKANSAAERDRLRKQDASVAIDPIPSNADVDVQKVVEQRRKRGEMVDDLDVMHELDQRLSGQEV